MKRAFITNDRSGASRDARRRARFRLDALTAVLTGTLVLAAACGGSSSTDPSSAQPMNLQTLTAKALAYAKCMRTHGFPNFPDPTVQDNANEKGVGFSLGAGIDKSSPQYKSATNACRRQTGFGVVSPAMIAAAMASALKFSECMRSHGIANYPDPVNHGHNIQLGPGPDSGIATNSARFKAAQKACTPLLPNGGP